MIFNADNFPMLGEPTALGGNPDLMLEGMGPERFASALDVPEWIRGRRAPESGRLSMIATAAQLGIDLVFEDLDNIKGQVRGLEGDEDLIIAIDPRYDTQEVTFGHEVGHLMLELAGINYPTFTDEDRMSLDLGRPTPGMSWKFQHKNRIERLCDIIGVHYALPLVDLESLSTVDEETALGLFAEYGTSLNETLYQLIRAGKLPRRFKVESKHTYGPREGEPGHLDYICYDCRVDFGSCLGAEMGSLTLDFNDHDFGGHFPVCKSLPMDMEKAKDSKLDRKIAETVTLQAWGVV